MAAELVVVKGESRGAFISITGPVTIGRSEKVELPLPGDTKASSKHARISPVGGDRYLLEDLESTNGTFVNQERIEQVPLRSGDLIKIGRSLLVFRSDGSMVRLEDIALVGGGVTGSIAKRKGNDVDRASTSSASLPPPGQEGARDETVARAHQEVVVAMGQVDLAAGLDRALDAVLEACGAGRVLLFLRHPITGGLGCSASRNLDRVPWDTAVDPDLLREAVEGQEVVTREQSAAASLRILGLPAGAIYIDGCPEGPRNLTVLTVAGVLLGLRLGLDRSRRLSSSAIEIVDLAQAQVNRQSFDVSAHLQAVDRLYARVARERGLRWEVSIPADPLLGSADPILFGRGFDKLIEHALAESSELVRISVGPWEGKRVQVIIRHSTSHDPEVFAKGLDPEGVAADLRRADETFGDGQLTVARVALMRAGARFSLRPDAEDVVFSVELEPGTPSGVL